MGMQVGKWNRLFTITSPTETQDSYGEPDASFSGSTQFWGSFVIDRSTEAYSAAAQTDRTEQHYQIETRYRTDLTAKMRLTCDSVTYEIEGVPVDPDGRRERTMIGVVLRG